MKLAYILILLPLFSCHAQRKLKIETILAKTVRVSSQDPATGRIYNTNTRAPLIPRLDPRIVLESNSGNKLIFQLQGNVSSGGRSINKVQKIRSEKPERIEQTITLKYFVEIKNIPGKEGANVLGYNYNKEVTYKIPDGVKRIQVELYENRLNSGSTKHPKLKLVAQETFNSPPKISFK